MAVYINGTPLKFEVLETADPTLIAELDRCIQFGRGGVFSISAEEFAEESKKKLSETNSESGYKQRRQRLELSSLHINPNRVAGAVSAEVGQTFASPQLSPFGGPLEGRAHTPRNQFGLPGGPAGPSGAKPMPDPIELPTGADFKPPTAKMSDVLI